MNPTLVEKTLDLRGQVCPYTFLYCKLTLEEMSPGEELAILLNHPPALLTVPRSLTEEGHQVLALEPQ